MPSPRQPVRVVALLIVVWIGAYWIRTPGGAAPPEALSLSSLSDIQPDRSPEGGQAFSDAPSAAIARTRADEQREPADLPLAGNTPKAEPEPRTEPQRTHTVVRGDTLDGIALREYGSVRYGRLIFNANRDQLRSADDLDLGMVLRLPARPDR